MKRTKFLSACIFLLIAATSAQAQTTQPAEQARIKQGVKSGELTKPEARKLEVQQRDIRQDKKAAKADGTVTAAEKSEINKDKKQASRNIYRKKHNAKTQN